MIMFGRFTSDWEQELNYNIKDTVIKGSAIENLCAN